MRQRRAVHVGHPQVADHRVDAAGLERRQRPPAARRGGDASGRPRRSRSFSSAAISGSSSTTSTRPPALAGAGASACARRLASRQRQVHPEARALAAGGVELDPPAMGGDDAVADREPDAGADALRLGGEERLEGAAGHVGRPCRARCRPPRAPPRPPSAQARTVSRRGAGRPISACWAFTTRFTTTWCSWSASPCTGARPAGRSSSTSTSALRSP